MIAWERERRQIRLSEMDDDLDFDSKAMLELIRLFFH